MWYTQRSTPDIAPATKSRETRPAGASHWIKIPLLRMSLLRDRYVATGDLPVHESREPATLREAPEIYTGQKYPQRARFFPSLQK